MEVTLNGKVRELADGTTVTALLDELGVPVDHTAVELNGALLERDGYGRSLAPGDAIEVVRFVGGG